MDEKARKFFHKEYSELSDYERMMLDVMAEKELASEEEKNAAVLESPEGDSAEAPDVSDDVPALSDADELSADQPVEEIVSEALDSGSSPRKNLPQKQVCSRLPTSSSRPVNSEK